jgi:peptide/nickel transport system permease protein
MRRLPAIYLAILLLACLLGPLWAQDPLALDPAQRLQPPSWEHLLGTDALGRDLLARLLAGGRVSLWVAAAATLGAVGLGGAVGLIAGYFGGWVDAALMRLTELFLAVPKLPLLVLLAAVDPARAGLPVGRLGLLIGIIVAFGWMSAARLARAAALPLREADFVRAARGFGAGPGHVIRVHLLPHAAGPLLVAASLDLGEFIIYENVLSFLGLGVPAPDPSWGSLLAEAFVHLERAPVLAVAPGLLTFLTVAAFNRAGDQLRDALDPRGATASRTE